MNRNILIVIGFIIIFLVILRLTQDNIEGLDEVCLGEACINSSQLQNLLDSSHPISKDGKDGETGPAGAVGPRGTAGPAGPRGPVGVSSGAQNAACVDKNKRCPNFKKHCNNQRYIHYMRNNCKKTCNLC